MNTIRQRTLGCVASLLLLTSPATTRGADHFINAVDFWFYMDNGVDQGTAWKTPDFSHFEWNFGVSEFGFGDGDEFTELNPSPSSGPLRTAYFRTRFSTDPTIYSNVTIRLRRDDGGIVYINGVEAFRNNMPTGAVNYATPAIRSINGAEESMPAQRVVPATFLDAVNTIAVEIHQAAGDTEDMSFALEMIGHRVGENQPPSAYSGFATVEQGKSKNIVLNAIDPDNNPLTYTLLSLPEHGSLTGDGGNWIYTPTPGYLGTDLFAFRASDGQWQTEEAYVSIEVIPPSNQPPVAHGQDVTMDEDTTLPIALNATDPDGDTLVYAHTAPMHGTLAGAGNSLVYQPAPNYHGPDSFTFTVSDGNGETSTARINITVVPINDLPTAGSQIVEVAEDESATITIVANDVDGDSLTLTYTLPSHGSLVGTGGTLTYHPSPNFFGQDTFSFTVSDGTGFSTGSISIVVTPVNDAPIAKAKASPAHAPESYSRKLVILALNNQFANVILDGTGSEDIDSELTFAWFINAGTKPASTAVSPVVALPLGNHSVTLQVSDGLLLGSDIITVRVSTAGELVRNLIAAVEAAPLTPGERNSPLNILKTAASNFDAKNVTAGVDSLLQFQRRVSEKISDPALAKYFIDEAGNILDLVKASTKAPASPRPRGKR